MHPRLNEALDQGHGVLDRRQHPALRHVIDHAVRAQHLVRVLPHIYARPADASTLLTRARAAWLSHPDAVVTGLAAAIIGGWDDLDEPELVSVALPRRQRPVPGFHFVERTVPRALWRRADAVRITTFPMTALDLALEFGPARLDDALRRGVEHRKLREALAATPHRRGYAALRREVDARRDTPWSPLECAAHELLRGASIDRWWANHAIYEQRDVRVGYGDLVFFDLRLVLELDGKGSHSGDGNARRDKARDLRLARLGWEVIRLDSDLVFKTPTEFVAVVKDILRTRRGRQLNAQ